MKRSTKELQEILDNDGTQELLSFPLCFVKELAKEILKLRKKRKKIK